MAAQQLSGVGFILCFSTAVLRSSRLTWPWIIAALGCYHVVNIAATALSYRVLESVGRLSLLRSSLLVTSAALVSLTIGLQLSTRYAIGPPLVCASLGLHAAAFGVGVGPTPWLLPHEIFEAGWQAAANRFTAATHWLTAFLSAQTFLLLYELLGSYCLLLNAALLLVPLGLAALAPDVFGPESLPMSLPNSRTASLG